MRETFSRNHAAPKSFELAPSLAQWQHTQTGYGIARLWLGLNPATGLVSQKNPTQIFARGPLPPTLQPGSGHKKKIT